jgi:hypothetical protein
MAEKKPLTELPSKNTNEMEWEATRFSDFHVKVLALQHKCNFSIGKMAPGGRNFAHAHGFPQVRYVLEGEFIVNGKSYGPGSFIEFPPFVRYESYSPNGGVWLQIQVPNPETGDCPTDSYGHTYGGADGKVQDKTAA